MAYSEAQKRASKAYNDKHYVSLSIRMKPEEKEIIMQAAAAAGMSVKNLILSLIEK